MRELVGDADDRRGGRALDLQPHRALPRRRRPGRGRERRARRARAARRHPPDRAASRASTRCATATPRATSTASTSGLESMVVGEAEVQGQVKRAYEAALAAQHDRAADQQALPRRAGDRQARAHRDRDLRRPRAASPRSRSTLARDALGDLARAPRADHRRRRDRRADRAGAARRRACATMFVANRRRERAIALAQRFGGDTVAFDALPERARARRHRRRLDLLAAPDRSAPRSSALVMPRRAAGGRCC